MKITSMRANHVEEPLGFCLDNLSLSWKAAEAEGKKTVSSRVSIALDPDFQTIVSDSGWRGDIDSLSYCPELALAPRTRYYWKAEVKSDAGEEASGVSWFETAKRDEVWEASWITIPEKESAHPLLRQEFSLNAPVRRARAYVCGLGLYELYLNGKKVGDEYLTPNCNDYRLWIQYQTYDITSQLCQGENVVGAMLGNGWYKGRFGFEKMPDGIFGDRFGFLCEIHIELENGEEICVVSDPTWKWYPSPILESGIYDGEMYDARLLSKDWCLPGGGEAFRPTVLLENLTFQKLTERYSLPVKAFEALPVKEVIHTPKGETVLDFGQEITGWVEFVCREPYGKKVFLQYCEILQDGCFHNENLRSARAEMTYISDGQERFVRPHFTYYGFRYVRVQMEGEVDPYAFAARVVHSDLEFTGHLETSDSRVNRLIQNAFWSQRGNFLDVPTDCPQRDERMGWTGDAQIFAATASFNMYSPAFYRKYMHDMLEEQQHMFHGSVAHVVPMVIRRAGNGWPNYGSCAWSDAAAVIPWTEYVFYGDKELLREQYTNMRLWAECLIREDKATGGKYLRQTGFHFADWLALDCSKENRFGGTDPFFVASAYYYYSIVLTAKAACVLGLDADAQRYSGIAEKIKTAFQKEYLIPGGGTKPGTQTSYVVALYFGLVPEEDIAHTAALLRKKLEEDNVHLTTGFVGTPYLCPTLSRNGSNDYAYQLLFNDDFPSWLYEVKMGATTIWERWNSVLPDGYLNKVDDMNSLNHYAYGSIVEWMYRDMAGINPCEDAPGFRKIRIKPQPDPRLGSVDAELETPFGLCRSAWRYENGKLAFDLTIPYDTEAEVTLPIDGNITVNGKEVTASSFRLTAGSYHFEA